MNTYIIAEMAWSHTGSLGRAIQIVEGAAQAGANAISLHITDMPSYMAKDYRCAAGTTLSDSADESIGIYEYLNSINLNWDDWKQIGERAKSLNIDLVVMCNDRTSFEFSKQLDVSRYVISAASFLELDLVADIARFNSEIILRTGGATLNEIHIILNKIFDANGGANVCLLAGIQLYPTAIQDLHLASLVNLSREFEKYGISMGLADHIDGDNPYAIYLPALAIAIGAQVLEKHITTDRSEKLEDYEAALGINQFAEFVDYVRIVEEALGDGSISYMTDNQSYSKYRDVVRKKIVVSSDVDAGQTITREMLTFKRADYGAQIDELDQIVGRRLIVSKRVDDGISTKDVRD